MSEVSAVPRKSLMARDRGCFLGGKLRAGLVRPRGFSLPGEGFPSYRAAAWWR